MLDPDCLFCKIVEGKIPAQKVYEDGEAIVFRDISPKAPVHLLAIPKTHYASVDAIDLEHMGLMTGLFRAVKSVVEQENLTAQGGYRLVINAGPNAGQEVPHIHIHILAGRPLSWPPG